MLSVTSTPSLKQDISLAFLSITEAKIQRFANAFFGILSIMLANFLYEFGGLIAFASLPLYLITVTFAIRFFQVKDYSRPERIEDYRKAALEQTLEEVIREHGLYNTLKYEIVPHGLFGKKLEQYLFGLKTPGQIASFYIEFQSTVENCGLSIDNFRPVFVKVVDKAIGGNATRLFANGEMPLLIRAGFPTKALLEAYQEYQVAAKAYRDGLKMTIEEYSISFWTQVVAPFASATEDISSLPLEIQEWIRTVLRDLSYLFLGERRLIANLNEKVGTPAACSKLILQMPMQCPIDERVSQDLKLWKDPPSSFSTYGEAVRQLNGVRTQTNIWVGKFIPAVNKITTQFKGICEDIDSRWR